MSPLTFDRRLHLVASQMMNIHIQVIPKTSTSSAIGLNGGARSPASEGTFDPEQTGVPKQGRALGLDMIGWRLRGLSHA